MPAAACRALGTNAASENVFATPVYIFVFVATLFVLDTTASCMASGGPLPKPPGVPWNPIFRLLMGHGIFFSSDSPLSPLSQWEQTQPQLLGKPECEELQFREIPNAYNDAKRCGGGRRNEASGARPHCSGQFAGTNLTIFAWRANGTRPMQPRKFEFWHGSVEQVGSMWRHRHSPLLVRSEIVSSTVCVVFHTAAL